MIETRLKTKLDGPHVVLLCTWQPCAVKEDNTKREMIRQLPFADKDFSPNDSFIEYITDSWAIDLRNDFWDRPTRSHRCDRYCQYVVEPGQSLPSLSVTRPAESNTKEA